MTRVCADPRCTNVFIPDKYHPDQIYCFDKYCRFRRCSRSEATKQYKQSPGGRAATKRYSDGVAGKAARKRYKQGKACRATAKRYVHGPAGILTQRNGKLRYRYGLLFHQYNKLKEISKCPITGKTEKLEVDHKDMEINGKIVRVIRGIIFGNINGALGPIKDDIIILNKMIIYCQQKPKTIEELGKENGIILEKREKWCREKRGGMLIVLSRLAELLREKQTCCDICGTTESNGLHGVWQIDHIKGTTLTRGLLCWRCNTVLGLFEDNIEWMRKAIIYLNQDFTNWSLKQFLKDRDIDD
jgi:Recombination endonuclease VII